MSKRTVFTELSVCETLIMRQIWAYEGDIPVQTLIMRSMARIMPEPQL